MKSPEEQIHTLRGIRTIKSITVTRGSEMSELTTEVDCEISTWVRNIAMQDYHTTRIKKGWGMVGCG